ncbi:hypothetical protein L7F22_055625 [Adiantum nelumboides]|nr:hypothetical protein [Adiantum nelumboides]
MATISQITAACNMCSSHTTRSSTVPAPACIRSNLKDRAASETGARVFVGNIPMYAREEEVAEALSVFGPVVAFKLVVDRASGRPKGYGFCDFRDEETALSAQRNQKGAALCHGRQLRMGPVGARLKQQQQQQRAGSASSRHETSWQAAYPARPQQQKRELDVFALRQAKKLRLKLMPSPTIQIKPADATATTSSGALNSGSSGLSYSRKRDYSYASASHDASPASSRAGSTASCPDVFIAANQDGAGCRPEKKAQRILSNQDQRGGDIGVVAESTSTYGSTCSSPHQVDESVKVDDQLKGPEFAGMPSASCSTSSSPTSIMSSEAGCDQPQLDVHVDIMQVEAAYGRLVTSDVVDNTGLGPDDCHYIAEYAKQDTPTDDDVLAEYRGTQLQQVNEIQTSLQPQLTTPTHGSDPNSIQSGVAASADVDNAAAAASAGPSHDDVQYVEGKMVRDLQALLHLLQANITCSSKYIYDANKQGQMS